MKLNTERWSAPKKMIVFILICMIVVFSFESLGLTNKEGNLEIRKASVILVQSEGHDIDHSIKAEEPTKDILNKLSTETIKLKKEKQEKLSQIIMQGAHNLYFNEVNGTVTTDNFYDL